MDPSPAGANVVHDVRTSIARRWLRGDPDGGDGEAFDLGDVASGDTAMVSTLPGGASNRTVVDHGALSPPAGMPGAGDWPTLPVPSRQIRICRLSSTPVILPPTVVGEVMVAP